MAAGGGGMRASQETRWRQNVKETVARRRRAERKAQEERANEERQRKEALERRKAEREMSDKYLRAPAQAPPQPQKPILRKGAGRNRVSAKPPPDAVAKPTSPRPDAKNVQARLRAHIRQQREKIQRQKAAQEPISVDDAGVDWHTARQMAAQGLDHLLQEVMPCSSPDREVSPNSNSAGQSEETSPAAAAPMRDLSSLLAEMGPPPELPCPHLVLESGNMHRQSPSPQSPEPIPEHTAGEPSTADLKSSHTQSPQHAVPIALGEAAPHPLNRDPLPEYKHKIACQPRLSLLLEQMGPPRLRPGVHSESAQHGQLPGTPASDPAEHQPTGGMPAWAELAGTLDSLESREAPCHHPQDMPPWAHVAGQSPAGSRDQSVCDDVADKSDLLPPRQCLSPGRQQAVAPPTCPDPAVQSQGKPHPDQTDNGLGSAGQSDRALQDSCSASRGSNRGSLDDSAQSFDFGTPGPVDTPGRLTNPEGPPPGAGRQGDYGARACPAAEADRVGNNPAPDPEPQAAAATSDQTRGSPCACHREEICSWTDPAAGAEGADKRLWAGVRPTGDQQLDYAALETSTPRASPARQAESPLSAPSPSASKAHGQERTAAPTPLKWEIPTTGAGAHGTQQGQGPSGCPQPGASRRAVSAQHPPREGPVPSPGYAAGLGRPVSERAGPTRAPAKKPSQLPRDLNAGVEGQRQCQGSYAEAVANAKQRAERERVERERLAAELAKRRAEVAARDAKAKAKAEKEQAAARPAAIPLSSRPVYAATPSSAAPPGPFHPAMAVAPPMPTGAASFLPGFVPMPIPYVPHAQAVFGGFAQPRQMHIQASPPPPPVLSAHPTAVSAPANGAVRNQQGAQAAGCEQPSPDDLQAVQRLNMSIELSDDEGDADAPDLPDDWEEQLRQPRRATSSHNRHGPSNFAKSPLAAALLDLVGLPGMHGQHAVSTAKCPSTGGYACKPSAAGIHTGLSMEEEDLLASLRKMDPGVLRKSMKAVGLDFWSGVGGGLSNSVQQEQLLASLERLDGELHALRGGIKEAAGAPTTSGINGVGQASRQQSTRTTPQAPSQAPAATTADPGPASRVGPGQQAPAGLAPSSSSPVPAYPQSKPTSRQALGTHRNRRSPSPSRVQLESPRHQGYAPSDHLAMCYAPMFHPGLAYQAPGVPQHLSAQVYPSAAGMPVGGYHHAVQMPHQGHQLPAGWHQPSAAALVPQAWSQLKPPEPCRQPRAAAPRGASPPGRSVRPYGQPPPRDHTRGRSARGGQDSAGRAAKPQTQPPAAQQGVINCDQKMIGLLFS